MHALHNTLKGYPLANRDYVWTTFINGKTSDEERLIQLIQLYNKGDVLEGVNKEQIRLLLHQILFNYKSCIIT